MRIAVVIANLSLVCSSATMSAARVRPFTSTVWSPTRMSAPEATPFLWIYLFPRVTAVLC